MLIKKLKLENIRSYENQEIEFPTGSILLSGDVGAGKTSVLMAIEFALFGLQPAQRGSSLLKNGKDSARIVLELEIEGRNVVLERILKKSGKTISQDYSSISIDNEKFEGSVTEIKNRVLGLLNYPSEFAKKTNLLYKFTVYTPQEEMKQIILESPEVRLNTLRHVFGIDKYKRIEENIKIFTGKLREEIRNQEGQLADIDSIKTNLREKKQRILVLRETHESEKKILEEKNKTRKLTEEEAKKIEEKIQEKENLEKEKDKANLMLINKRDSATDLKNQIEKLEKELEQTSSLSFDEQKFQYLLDSIKNTKEQEKHFQEKIINFSSKLNSLIERKKETEQLKEKIAHLKTCPTCLQEVNEQYKENIFKKADSEIFLINKETQELEQQKSNVSSYLENARKEISELERKKSEQEITKIRLESIKEKRDNLVELDRKRRKVEMDREMMLKHLKSLEEGIQQFEKYTKLYEEKQQQLDEKRDEERQQEIKVAELNKEIDLTLQNITEIEIQIKEKQTLKEKLDYLKSLENWMTDKLLNLILLTEENVMLKLREEFSKLFSEWFSVLVSDNLSVRLDEQFSPIMEQQGFEISYNYLSGGERTAVALAYRLSLNQVINSLLSKIKTRDLVILDEPTDGFSEAQLDKIRDVLHQLKITQLILVSHEAKIEGFVDNIIRFKKERGVTRIEG